MKKHKGTGGAELFNGFIVVEIIHLCAFAKTNITVYQKGQILLHVNHISLKKKTDYSIDDKARRAEEKGVLDAGVVKGGRRAS